MTVKEDIHIVYGTDDNYIFPTMVSAASAIYFSKNPERLVIHLFDAGVTDADYANYESSLRKLSSKVRLVRHPLKPAMFSGFGEWKGSVVTYSRMFMAEILPELDWAIYVDGDTLWLGSPDELWGYRDEAMLIVASKDPPRPLEDVNPEWQWYADRGLEIDCSKYLCMGLMLANLKLMRQKDIPCTARMFMKKYPSPRIVDQTVLNYVCRGFTKALPANWGVFSAWHQDVDLSKPSIVHYVSDVPWLRNKPNKLFSDVVLLWFAFCSEVLGINELSRFSKFTFWWRRMAFNICRHIQPILKINRYVHSRLRNTHGIPARQMKMILAKFKHGSVND